MSDVTQTVNIEADTQSVEQLTQALKALGEAAVYARESLDALNQVSDGGMKGAAGAAGAPVSGGGGGSFGGGTGPSRDTGDHETRRASHSNRVRREVDQAGLFTKIESQIESRGAFGVDPDLIRQARAAGVDWGETIKAAVAGTPLNFPAGGGGGLPPIGGGQDRGSSLFPEEFTSYQQRTPEDVFDERYAKGLVRNSRNMKKLDDGLANQETREDRQSVRNMRRVAQAEGRIEREDDRENADVLRTSKQKARFYRDEEVADDRENADVLRGSRRRQAMEDRLDREERAERRRPVSEAREEQAFLRTVSRAQARTKGKAHEDPVVRAMMAERGIPEEEFESQAEAFAAQAKEQGLAGGGRGKSTVQALGMLYRGVAYTGLGYETADLARQYYGARSAGTPFRPEEHAGSLYSVAGSVVGAGIGAALTPWLGPGAIEGGMLSGGILGSMVGQSYEASAKGGRERRELETMVGVRTGIRSGDLRALEVGHNGPAPGLDDRHGTDGWYKSFAAVKAWDAASGQFAQATDRTYAAAESSRLGGASEAEVRAMTTGFVGRYRDVAPDAMEASREFRSDPFMGRRTMNSLRGHLGGPMTGGLSEEDVWGGILRYGPDATQLNVAATGRQDLLDRVGPAAQYLAGSAITRGSLASDTAGAAAGVARAESLGAAPGSRALEGANRQLLDTTQRQIASQEEYVRTIDALAKQNPYLLKEAHDATAALGQMRAGLEGERTRQQLARADARIGRAERDTEMAGLDYGAQAAALDSGTDPAAFGTLAAGYSRTAAAETAKYNNHRFTEPQRGAARLAARRAEESLRVLLKDNADRRYGSSISEAGVEADDSGAEVGFQGGADAGTLSGAYARRASALGREGAATAAYLGFAAGHRQLGYSGLDLARLRARGAQIERDRQAALLGEQMTPLLRGEAAVDRAGSETAAAASLVRGAGLGSRADEAALSAMGAQKLALADNLTKQAAALGRSDPRRHAEEIAILRSRAALERTGAAALSQEAAGAYSLSDRQANAVSALDLARNLAHNDLGGGGQVPYALSRMAYDQSGAVLADIEAKVRRTDPSQRDRARAATMPMYEEMSRRRQEAYNEMQYGSQGRLLNESFGMDGSFTLFGPSTADFQRQVPGGTQVLGGSGRGVMGSPALRAAMDAFMTPSGALGSSENFGPEVVSKLTELIQVFRDAFRPGVGVGMHPLADPGQNGPDEAARRRSTRQPRV